jgi:hypothetical protein
MALTLVNLNHFKCEQAQLHKKSDSITLSDFCYYMKTLTYDIPKLLSSPRSAIHEWLPLPCRSVLLYPGLSSDIASWLIPISVLRDHSKLREISHRTKTLRVGFQLIESFTYLVNHGIKRGKSEIRELFFA